MKLALLAAALLLPSLAAAGPVEETVTIPTPNGPLVGTLTLPEGGPAEVVLMFHGFTGQRHELATEAVPEGVFARTAARLAEAGFASLRIDFRGSGESTADIGFSDTTFEGQVADGLAALDWLKSLDRVRGDDIDILGWSQGGLVAAAVAGRSRAPDAVALWAAVADPEESFGGLLGAELVAAAAAGPAEAVSTVKLPWGAEIALKGTFFQGVQGFDPTAEIAPYGGPLLVAHGTLDTTVLPRAADLFLAAHDGPEVRFDAEMDHVFNVFTDDVTLERLIGVTAEFFRTTD